jgi:hypothetical protein
MNRVEGGLCIYPGFWLRLKQYRRELWQNIAVLWGPLKSDLRFILTRRLTQAGHRLHNWCREKPIYWSLMVHTVFLQKPLWHWILRCYWLDPRKWLSKPNKARKVTMGQNARTFSGDPCVFPTTDRNPEYEK